MTLEHLKRIEGEVFTTYESIAERQTMLESGHTVDPHQLLGIEINPRAVAIADLVLWIGYLQWHYRTRGNVNPPEPVLKNFKNIECRDALLSWSSTEPQLDEQGKPVTRWDGRTTKPHPVTGEKVPDEAARVLSLKYNNPKKAEWPKADFVVGNPPYLGARVNRRALGDGYLTALRGQYGEVPENCDYVMYWWYKAALLVREKNLDRFGLITTKSISQPFAIKLTSQFLEIEPFLSFSFAIPNHPWVDAADGADVLVAMTIVRHEKSVGELHTVESETTLEDGEVAVAFDVARGLILPNLTIGANVASACSLAANRDLSCVGYQLSGQGFVIPKESLSSISWDSDEAVKSVVRPLFTARDIVQSPRNYFAANLTGYKIDESAQAISRIVSMDR